jgi:hypothetical protein
MKRETATAGLFLPLGVFFEVVVAVGVGVAKAEV